MNRSSIKILAVVVLATAFLYGCLMTQQQIRLSKGRPDTTICGVTKNDVMEKFAAIILESGRTIKTTNQFQIISGKRLNDAASILHYDAVVELRTIFNFADRGDGCTYIAATVQAVYKSDTRFEHIDDVSGGTEGYKVDRELDNIKMILEGPAYAARAPKLSRLGYPTLGIYVDPGSKRIIGFLDATTRFLEDKEWPARKCLKIDDKIITVDGVAIDESDPYDLPKRLPGNNPTEVTITAERGGQQIECRIPK